MNETPRKVTLEDLLRIKRAEQPPAEFWDQFERGMRTKQLAAIVEPRPWWSPFIRVGTKFARYQVPVGATAILAVTFMTLRDYRSIELPTSYEPVVTVRSNMVNSGESVNATAQAQASESSGSSQDGSGFTTDEAESGPVADSVPANANVAANTLVGTSSHIAPLETEMTPSARYIADNLALAKENDPELDQMLGRSIRNIESRPVQEPLSQVNVPGQSRRARLFGGQGWLTSASNNGESALRDDDSSRRLTERRLSESGVFNRVAVAGSGVTVKF